MASRPRSSGLTALPMPSEVHTQNSLCVVPYTAVWKSSPGSHVTQAQCLCPEFYNPSYASMGAWEFSIPALLEAFHTCLGENLHCFPIALSIKSNPFGITTLYFFQDSFISQHPSPLILKYLQSLQVFIFLSCLWVLTLANFSAWNAILPSSSPLLIPITHQEPSPAQCIPRSLHTASWSISILATITPGWLRYPSSVWLNPGTSLP